MKFSDIPGREYLKSRLREGADAGRISHAQLFTGMEGTGALPLALAYAAYINCTGHKDGDSCGVCPSCVKYAVLAHPDLHFVFPVNTPRGSNKKPLSEVFIDQWRELWQSRNGLFNEAQWYGHIGLDNQQGNISRAEADEVIRKLAFKNYEARYKVLIIWLPERMRAEAANSLLKLLEEPWDNTLFLLVSPAPELLLPTIISRCQEITIAPPEPDDTAAFLVRQHGIDPLIAAEMARTCAGDLLTAIDLANDNTPSASNFEAFAALMRFSYNDRHMELLDWADEIAAAGREQLKGFFDYSVRMLRDSYMVNAGMGSYTNLRGEEADFCSKFHPFINNDNIEKLVQEMETAKLHIIRNGNPKIVLSHFALTVSKLIQRQP